MIYCCCCKEIFSDLLLCGYYLGIVIMYIRLNNIKKKTHTHTNTPKVNQVATCAANFELHSGVLRERHTNH